MRILYFGVYNPDYSRNRILIRGLKASGVEIIKCRVPAKSRLKYIKLFWRFMRSPGFDLMMVGFPGQEIMFLARFLTSKPIIFDAFTSHYGGYVLDRKKNPIKSFRAKYYRFLDKWSCKLANIILLDTQAHINFFVKEFNLPSKKFKRIFVGTDPDVFYPRETLKDTDKFLVHFHGYYIPLQGVKYIIKAAKFLEKDDVRFNIIGNGQTFRDDLKLAEDLSVDNINFIPPVSYEELPLFMAKADICLGIFGDSPKTDLVIPNKVYEAVAMKKPVITADTQTIRELFDENDMVLIRAADPKAIANAILMLKSNPELMFQMTENSYKKFLKFTSPQVLGKELLGVMLKLT